MRFILFSLLLFIGFSVSAQGQVAPVKGTWIANVASNALYSSRNIRKAVRLCKKNGLNSIFVVVWNDGVTMYPSELLDSVTGIKQDPVFKGFDPIAEIVRIGHRQGLKVHAWFEFGFSYAYKDSNSKWFSIHQNWQGKNNKGELLKKNGFYWWNAINPEVQQFMKKLVLEVVSKYDVDGVQGDDRMPAMPAEGGYDEYTKALYKKETGMEVPAIAREKNWLQWKADKISAFGKDLYHSVKAVKPGCLISWAPSIYPWSKEEYLQDWPRWLNEGYADFLMPQLYRYEIGAYENLLKQLSLQLTTDQKKIVFPGILTGLSDGYRVKPEMLKKMIALNRQYGYDGECQFYFESLRVAPKIY